MNLEHEKELWKIRFQRIFELEEESFNFYKKLLKEKAEILRASGIQTSLKKIMRDEGRHMRIAKDLIYIVEEALPPSGTAALPGSREAK